MGQGNQGEPAPNPATSAQSSSPESSNKEWKNTERISAELLLKGLRPRFGPDLPPLVPCLDSCSASTHREQIQAAKLWGGGRKKKKKEKKRDQKRDRERNIKILTYILLVLTVAWFFIPGRDSHRRAILINKSNIELVDLV